MAMITIRLPQELRDRIDELSEKSGRSKSFFIRHLIERGVADLEEELREIEEIRAAIRSGRRDFKTYSMDEVLAENGLTRMEVGMAPASKKTVSTTGKVSKAKNPKKTSSPKPKPASRTTPKRTKG